MAQRRNFDMNLLPVPSDDEELVQLCLCSQRGDQYQDMDEDHPSDHAGDEDHPSDHAGDEDRQDEDEDEDEDEEDTDSLILPIGRDITINCLLNCPRVNYGAIASLNSGFNRLIRSGEMYKMRRMNGVVEHWVYFSSEMLRWIAFDPVGGRWMNLPVMEMSPCFECSDKESLAVGTQLLYFGKEILSYAMYKYNLLTNSWSRGSDMSDPRCLFGSASSGNIGIIAGGCGSNGVIKDTAELYDSETETWELLPALSQPRRMASGAFMDGKFYVIGGMGADASVLTNAEEFDMETRTWKEIPGMSPYGTGAPRENGTLPATESPPLIAVVKNELYAADYADMEVRKFDKKARKWSTLGKLPDRADSMNGWGLAFRGCGDRLLVIGGPLGNSSKILDVYSWVPNGDDPPLWELLVRKDMPSFMYNCAVMGC